MITCFIVEDETLAIQRLAELVSEEVELELLGTSDNGEEAITRIESLQPQLLFLDVRLPDISGLDVLKILTHRPAVIFTTAYDEYAVEAFSQNAIDFLLKPLSRERFQQAIAKFKQQDDLNNMNVQMTRVLERWHSQTEHMIRIPSKIGERIFILNVQEIIYFASENKLIFAHLTDSEFLMNYTLDELERRLNPAHFFRIHRSTIVNLNFVAPFGPCLAAA